MATHAEASEPTSTDLSAEILQLRSRLRSLEPEDIHKLGDGLRRLRETLATVDERLSAAGVTIASRVPSRLWRSTWVVRCQLLLGRRIPVGHAAETQAVFCTEVNDAAVSQPGNCQSSHPLERDQQVQ